MRFDVFNSKVSLERRILPSGVSHLLRIEELTESNIFKEALASSGLDH
jgi:hypothetical protein